MSSKCEFSSLLHLIARLGLFLLSSTTLRLVASHDLLCALLIFGFNSDMSIPGTRDRLPIIDVAPLLNSDPKNTELRLTTAKALHSACIEYGFFYLNIEAYVNPSEPEELSWLGRQFFSLPQAEKDQLSLKNQDYARGMYSCKFQQQLRLYWYSQVMPS